MIMRHGIFLILSALVVQVLSSAGDRSKIFRDCLARCEEVQCDPKVSAGLPIALRLAAWTCSDDCKYRCMHATTTREVEMGLRVKQYYGKWPFWRLGGIQEPASVAFSLLNLWTHLRGGAKIRREISRDHPMKFYYLTWSFVSVNTWIWSSVFHIRDLAVTEKLDYFSAALTILFGLYISVIRILHLYPTATKSQLTLTTSDSPGRRSRPRVIWSSICILAFVGHVAYLTLPPNFDYLYNIIFNATVGLSHNLVWLFYALPHQRIRRFPSRPKSYRPTFVKKAGILVGFMTAAVCLELFDFPPWGRTIDAHALWHLSTALIAPHWYRFLVEDSQDESWHDHRL